MAKPDGSLKRIVKLTAIAFCNATFLFLAYGTKCFGLERFFGVAIQGDLILFLFFGASTLVAGWLNYRVLRVVPSPNPKYIRKTFAGLISIGLMLASHFAGMFAALRIFAD
jgi:hypothetical protein